MKEMSKNFDVSLLDTGDRNWARDEKLFGYLERGIGFAAEDKPVQIGGNLELLFIGGNHPTVPARTYHIGNTTIVAEIERAPGDHSTKLVVCSASQSHMEQMAIYNSLSTYLDAELKKSQKRVTAANRS
jgi:hypothetical protein